MFLLLYSFLYKKIGIVFPQQQTQNDFKEKNNKHKGEKNGG